MGNEPVLDWQSAPDQFRAAYDRKDAENARLRHQLRGVDSLRRELAMVRALGAGTVDGATGRAFATAYDGELTPEAIGASWSSFLAEAIGTLATERGGLHRLADTLDDDGPTVDELHEQHARQALYGVEAR